ncbi:MAG: GNAT family N-acetyltransferase [Bacteroidota bacterium]
MTAIPALFFLPVNENDLPEIEKLQPEHWGSIMPAIKWYMTLDFCYLIKAVYENEIVGCGAVLVNGNSAWLANIIVAKGHRNKGYGYAITEHILDYAKHQTGSVILIATKLGRPVYLKFGFNDDEEYLFFKAGKIERLSSQRQEPPSPYIIPYHPSYKDAILALDEDTFGEQRTQLLESRLAEALVYVQDDIFKGFTIPTLGEGLTLAYTPEAGLALMAVRFTEAKKACIPKANSVAVDYLLQHGFEVDDSLYAIKMNLGKVLPWKPQQQFGRVGGNMG